jgi:pyruvate formate lyase activating enzyme
MVLTTYGRSSGFCIDPIEKKPLNHFFPGTAVLSFGTAGCNLGCKFCQNWSISKAREWDKLAAKAGPLDIAGAAVKNGCKSVAFTYNDPVIFAEYAIDTAVACRERGVKSVAVSAGYIEGKGREDLFAELDAVNIDLKSFSEEFYQKLSLAHLAPVLDTLKYIRSETSTWLEITTLLIPGANDSEAEVAALCEWIFLNLGPDVPLHFSAFHPDFKMQHVPATPPATLKRAYSQAKRVGLRHVYTGNIHDPSTQATYCSGCGEVLVERDWYRLGKFRIVDNGCASCGMTVAGEFENEKGTWGQRRLPVVIR